MSVLKHLKETTTTLFNSSVTQKRRNLHKKTLTNWKKLEAFIQQPTS